MFTVQLGTVPLESRLITHSSEPFEKKPKSMTVWLVSVMLLTLRPPSSIKTIVLLCSGPISTAVYRSPMRAESTSVSMTPLKLVVPVLLSISVSDSPDHAAMPLFDASNAPLRPSRWVHFTWPSAVTAPMEPPS